MELRSTPQPSRRPVYTASRPPGDGAVTSRQHGLRTVDVVKGPSGLGFTLADTEHGRQSSHCIIIIIILSSYAAEGFKVV